MAHQKVRRATNTLHGDFCIYPMLASVSVAASFMRRPLSSIRAQIHLLDAAQNSIYNNGSKGLAEILNQLKEENVVLEVFRE